MPDLHVKHSVRASCFGAIFAGISWMATMSSTAADPRNDAQAVLTLALTDQRLVKFLNFTATPTVRVTNKSALDFGEMTLAVGNNRIAVVPTRTPDPQGIEITRAELEPDRASVALRYPRQGMRVRATFRRNASGWMLEEFRLVEN